MIEIRQLKVPISVFEDSPCKQNLMHNSAIAEAVANYLGINISSITALRLLKRSIDARSKKSLRFVLSLRVELSDSKREQALIAKGKAYPHVDYQDIIIPDLPAQKNRPIVVGTGPAGLFAALYLARAGLKPLVLEQGQAVDDRLKTVNAFSSGESLNLLSNIQFGEGGAGTFSDGKLTTGVKNPLSKTVLHWFVEAGAPEEILWQAKPHLGTDCLPSIVKTIRKFIVDAGGEVCFNTQLCDFDFTGGRLRGISVRNTETGIEQSISVETLVLATGHSARSMYKILLEKDILLAQKPFSLGVRIEHKQATINSVQYGKDANITILGAADYKLVQHLPSGRSVYTFCMCPGGEVVCAASEEGGTVVNGMSNFKRDGKNSNSALLVGISEADFSGESPLAGIELQKQIEEAVYQAAFAASGKAHIAISQTVGDFLAKTQGNDSKTVIPSYARGVVWGNLHDCLPDYICNALVEAIPKLDRKLKGFSDPQAVMTAPETRSSSPVRIVRNESFQASLKNGPYKRSGLYPCGEGSGYAGGIMSSAIDGLRIAQSIADKFAAASEG